MGLWPGADMFGNLLEGVEVACGVTVSPGVVRDDRFALAKQLDEILKGGHSGIQA